jgi:diadenosine tetraphosphate (Ap4A) HIT family hydrolase
MEKENCLICDRIKMINDNINPYFVAELETGYVVIADYQYFKGYTIFLCKVDVRELHLLEKNFKIKFLNEMSLVYEAVYNAFNPIKVNCELLGNSDPHVHWHIVPRYGTDSFPWGPAWLTDDKLLRADEAKPSEEELESLKSKLLVALKQVANNIVKEYSN